MNQIILTIFIAENIFLALFLIIFLYRKCQKCQQVKQIDQVFNKLCQNCQNSKPVKKELEL